MPTEILLTKCPLCGWKQKTRAIKSKKTHCVRCSHTYTFLFKGKLNSPLTVIKDTDSFSQLEGEKKPELEDLDFKTYKIKKDKYIKF